MWRILLHGFCGKFVAGQDQAGALLQTRPEIVFAMLKTSSWFVCLSQTSARYLNSREMIKVRVIYHHGAKDLTWIWQTIVLVPSSAVQLESSFVPFAFCHVDWCIMHEDKIVDYVAKLRWKCHEIRCLATRHDALVRGAMFGPDLMPQTQCALRLE